MFSVYGLQGRLFRGSLEQLRQVGGVGALARSRSLLPLEQEGRDRPAEAAGERQATASSHRARTGELQRNALAAYSGLGAALPRRPLRQVRDVMSAQAVTLSDQTTVLQAWQTLSQQGVGQAPVLAAGGQPIGLLTRADLLRPDRLPSPQSHALAWQALMLQNVTSVMLTPVPSAAPDADIRRVAQLLLDTGLPGLPVVDEAGAVLGFLSRTDILRAVVTDPPLDLWG